MRYQLLSATVLSFLASGCVTQSDVYKKTALSGREQYIGFFYETDENCRPVENHVSVVKYPTHGRLHFKTVPDFPNYSKTSTRRRCNYKRIPTSYAYYIPNRGYYGKDTTIIHEQSSIGRSTYNYEITVR
jgi:hypothetical protein